MNSKAFKLAAKIAAIAFGLACASMTHAATDWSTQDYDLYPGDFNGDGTTDMLYVGKRPELPSGIAIKQGNDPINWSQAWPSNYLGIQWHSNAFTPHVGDFNGDGRAEVFMQRNSPGDHYLLFQQTFGYLTLGISAISQTIPNSCRGVDWSSASHKIQVGDFNGDGTADFFLQSTAPNGLNAVVATRPPSQQPDPAAGMVESCYGAGPNQSWNDGYLGFKWSTRDANVYVGNFGGTTGPNGKPIADLLVQSKPKIVMIDYEIPIPIPVFAPNSFGVVFSQGGAAPFQLVGLQTWNRNAFGVDWSPNLYNLIIGNFNNSGVDDILFQARSSGRSSYLLTGTGSGSPFNTASALSSSVAWSADSVRLLAGNFNGNGVGMYFQATNGAGTNYIADSVIGTPNLVVHDTSTVTGIHRPTFVGTTVGSAGVTPSGQATYGIPLSLPAGINGLTPQLSVSYNSGGGPGVFGPKWDLGGLSSISRCSSTYAQNGSSGAPVSQRSDRYCLNGNQLRHVSGQYGSDGSTYQTEVANFSTITAHGDAGNGPLWFEVRGKDGLRYEYGSTGSSRMRTPSNYDPYVPLETVTAWSISKITDRSGNVIRFNYARDWEIYWGEYYLTRVTSIEYGREANATPLYKVEFDYNEAPFFASYSFAGGTITAKAVVTQIRVLYGSNQVRGYYFQYFPSGSGAPNQYLLSTIQECARSTAECLEPVRFNWSNGETDWKPMEGGTQTVAVEPTFVRTMDFNGDRRDDIVYYDAGASVWKVLWGTNAGYGGSTSTGFDSGTSFVGAAVVMDVDGNGADDLLVPSANGTWVWISWQPNGTFVVNATGMAAEFGWGTPMAASLDADGDGYQDLVTVTKTTTYSSLTMLRTEAPRSTRRSMQARRRVPCPSTHYVADILEQSIAIWMLTATADKTCSYKRTRDSGWRTRAELTSNP